jgi:hypothetical protein
MTLSKSNTCSTLLLANPEFSSGLHQSRAARQLTSDVVGRFAEFRSGSHTVENPDGRKVMFGTTSRAGAFGHVLTDQAIHASRILICSLAQRLSCDVILLAQLDVTERY